MSALKCSLVISSLNESAPERPARGDLTHLRRRFTPPGGCNGPLWLLCNGLCVQQGGSCCAGKPLLHSTALERREA